MSNRTISFFTIAILTIIFQELYRQFFSHIYAIGFMPMAIYGTIWNMINGNTLYRHLPDKTKFNFNKFNTLSIIAVVYIIIYSICWHLFRHKPTPYDEGSGPIYYIFMPISGLVAMIALYIPYYTINFVSRAIITIDNSASRKWLVALSIIFYPVGILWIQPKIDRITT